MTTRKTEIAIVGAGPRGTSTLERICASASKLLNKNRKLIIHVIDPYPPGPGRVWRTEQPPRLLMNTVAAQVTLFTDESVNCEGPHGSEHWGPSLYEWGKDEDGFRLDEKGYATRFQHGLYLKWAFGEICRRARKSTIDIEIKIHCAKAIKLDDTNDSQMQELTLTKVGTSEPQTLSGLSAVILLTQGHVDRKPDNEENRLTGLVISGIRYFPPRNPADIKLEELDAIRGGENVLIRGLGLVFFDYMILLTSRRGGWFKRKPDNKLEYIRSGNEPTIFAGSRRGIPYHAKAIDQTATNYFHTPVYLTDPAIERFRERAQQGDHPRFRTEVWPLISREVKLVYYNKLFQKLGREVPRDLNEILENNNDEEENMRLESHGVEKDQLWSWEDLQTPQRERDFNTMDEWNDWLLDYLRNNLKEANEGNVDGPEMAALNVLRDIRNNIRRIVNYQVLEAEDKQELIEKFTPFNSFLSTGPPLRRVEQMIALMEAKVLRVMGPNLKVNREDSENHWVVTTENPEFSQTVKTVIDAYIPPPDLNNTADELLQHLLRMGQCRAHTISDYPTGAIDISEEPYNIINNAGTTHPRRFAVGVPAEGIHWLTTTQPRPCGDSINLRQTDAIARAALRLANVTTQPHTLRET